MQIVLKPATAIILLVAIITLATATLTQSKRLPTVRVPSASAAAATNTPLNTKSEEQSSPFYGRPHPVPGRIEAEDYDKGGNGIGYYHNHIGGVGPKTRYREDGSLTEPCGDVKDRGHAVIIRQDSWFTYTIDVIESGKYGVTFRTANARPKGTLRIDVDGRRQDPDVGLPVTGSPRVWQDKGWAQMYLTRGTHTVRISGEGEESRLNYIDLWRLP